MTLQQLKYIVTVADCGNITEAAEKLFISQPSLSAAIHNLENEMGVTAFVRSNKGVTVTREGEELLSFARMLLEQADNMKDYFGGGEKHTWWQKKLLCINATLFFRSKCLCRSDQEIRCRSV